MIQILTQSLSLLSKLAIFLSTSVFLPPGLAGIVVSLLNKENNRKYRQYTYVGGSSKIQPLAMSCDSSSIKIEIYTMERLAGY